MKKKIAIIAIIAVAITCGAYFGIAATRSQTPYLESGFGIGESEMEFVANPGGYNVAYLTIINGHDMDRWVTVSLQQPGLNRLKDGYQPLPQECYDWFTLTGWDGEQPTLEPKVYLEAGEIREISIPVSIPSNTTFMNEPAQVMVQVTEVNPNAFQLMAVACKWYIVVVATPED